MYSCKIIELSHGGGAVAPCRVPNFTEVLLCRVLTEQLFCKYEFVAFIDELLRQFYKAVA